MRIPLARPSVSEADIAATERVLRSGQLVLGAENERFERALAEATSRTHAIACTSGTAALELALWALGIGPGDEVIVPAAGFPAAPNAVLRLGATPVAVDVEAGSWNLDFEKAYAAVGERTRAAVSIDLFGLVHDSAAAERFASAARIALVDDAACSLGASDADGAVGGSYGAIGTLSFHPRKVISTGEGGAIVCDDDELATILRELRNHGQAGRGRFARPGTNVRLPETAAAMGCAQLERLGGMISERRLLADGYCERLAPLRNGNVLQWQLAPEGAEHCYQTFAVRLEEGIDRAAVIARLSERDIEAGVATYSMTRLPTLAELPKVTPCSNAELLHDQGLALPLYVGMRSTELDRVCEALREVLR